MSNTIWNDVKLRILREGWESGMTASQIANQCGGVSRNMVIGKAHRLGLKRPK